MFNFRIELVMDWTCIVQRLRRTRCECGCIQDIRTFGNQDAQTIWNAAQSDRIRSRPFMCETNEMNFTNSKSFLQVTNTNSAVDCPIFVLHILFRQKIQT